MYNLHELSDEAEQLIKQAVFDNTLVRARINKGYEPVILEPSIIKSINYRAEEKEILNLCTTYYGLVINYEPHSVSIDHSNDEEKYSIEAGVDFIEGGFNSKLLGKGFLPKIKKLKIRNEHPDATTDVLTYIRVVVAYKLGNKFMKVGQKRVRLYPSDTNTLTQIVSPETVGSFKDFYDFKKI